jgi:drug/metabolite transporter (DMT)-like permease
MAVTHDVRPLSRGEASLGPQIMFAAGLLLAAAAWIVAAWSFSSDLTLPLVATLLFLLAGMAWSRETAARPRLSYWDVAGALTFIGIGATALIDPEQMLRLVGSAPSDIEGIGGRR